PGDRVAIMLRNSPEWLCLDQAVLSLGAVTVGLFCTDTPGNNASIIEHAGARVLVAVKQHWVDAVCAQSPCPALTHAFVFSGAAKREDARIGDADQALRQTAPAQVALPAPMPDSLASLVYPLGSGPQPRASRMSHANLLWCT